MGTNYLELYAGHISTLADRASSALRSEGFDRVLIHSGELQTKSPFDDQDWPYRAVPHFEHWAPIGWPGQAIFLEADRAPRLYVVRSKSFWERMGEPDWRLLKSGLEVVEVDNLDVLKEQLKKPKSAFIGHESSVASRLGVEESGFNPGRLVAAFNEMRVHKTPYEIACLAEASHRAVKGHLAAKEAFFAGERSELGLHLTYLRATQLDDAQTPYKNIIALGDAGAVLHHIHYRDVPDARSFLIDAGASYRGYHADITRTYVADENDDPSRCFAALIAGVESLQQTICDEIRVGRPYEELHDHCHLLLGQVLAEQGLVHCSAEAAVELGITRKFFPHGLGHSLGIQVHDVGCLNSPPKPENPWLRNTRSIEPNQVFTIEPGLYFIPALLDELRVGSSSDQLDWDRIDALLPFGGIRIEDNVQVLADGSIVRIRNLTREAFAAAGADAKLA